MTVPSLLDELSSEPSAEVCSSPVGCSLLVFGHSKGTSNAVYPMKARPEIIYPDPCCLLSFLCLRFSCFQQAAALASEHKVFSFPHNFILLFN